VWNERREERWQDGVYIHTPSTRAVLIAGEEGPF